MTPAEYLRAKGWTVVLYVDDGMGWWIDPLDGRKVVVGAAVDIQCARDLACEAFARGYQARQSIDRCNAANTAMAKAKAAGMGPEDVKAVGDAVIAGRTWGEMVGDD